MYAKLIDGTLHTPPNPLIINGTACYNPKPARLLEHGYLPVIDTEPPDDETTAYAPRWEIIENQIVKVWVPATPEEPQPAEPNPLEILQAENQKLKERLAATEQVVAETSAIQQELIELLVEKGWITPQEHADTLALKDPSDPQERPPIVLARAEGTT